MISINKHILKLKPSATLAINQKVIALRANGESVCHFGFGQSPFPIHESIVKALRKNANKSGYLPTLGLESLRQQIQYFLKNQQSIDANWETIFIGPGSKELLYQTILILEGTFLIPKGSWVSYGPQIKSKGQDFVVIETEFKDNFKLNANTLSEYCKNIEGQKTLILNSPNNPTGAVYSIQELKEIAQVCREYELIVLSDEIYSQINFNDDFSPSIFNYYPEKTIVFGGISKVFSAGGYRLGFMALPKDFDNYQHVFRSLFSETFSAVAAPVQFAAIEAFKMENELNVYVKNCSNILRQVSSYIYNEFDSVNIQCTQPQGAFYIIIGFQKFQTQINALGIYTSIELANYLLDKFKIALLPGSDFYFSDEELFFRLAFVDFNGEAALETSKTGNFLLEPCFESVILGVEKLKEFIKLLDD